MIINYKSISALTGLIVTLSASSILLQTAVTLAAVAAVLAMLAKVLREARLLVGGGKEK